MKLLKVILLSTVCTDCAFSDGSVLQNEYNQVRVSANVVEATEIPLAVSSIPELATEISFDQNEMSNMAMFAHASYSKNSSRDTLIDSYKGLGFTVDPFGYNQKGSIDGHAGLLSFAKDVNGENIITISFRGTESKLDWTAVNLHNLFGTQLEDHSDIFGDMKGNVHTGILKRYRSCRFDLHLAINKLLVSHNLTANDVKFKLTGHSLGGALASIAAVDLMKTFELTNEKLMLTTFSSPRLYNKSAAVEVDACLGKNVYRVWMENDIVPAINPGFLGNKHIGQSLKLKSTTNFFQFSDGFSFLTTLFSTAKAATPVSIAVNGVSGNYIKTAADAATLTIVNSGVVSVSTAAPVIAVAALAADVGMRYASTEHSIESLKDTIRDGAKPVKHTPFLKRVKKFFSRENSNSQ